MGLETGLGPEGLFINYLRNVFVTFSPSQPFRRIRDFNVSGDAEQDADASRTLKSYGWGSSNFGAVAYLLVSVSWRLAFAVQRC